MEDNREDYYHRDQSRKKHTRHWVRIFDETAGEALTNYEKEERKKMKDESKMKNQSFTLHETEARALEKMSDLLKVNKSKLARDGINIMLCLGPEDSKRARDYALSNGAISVSSFIARLTLAFLTTVEELQKIGYGVPDSIAQIEHLLGIYWVEEDGSEDVEGWKGALRSSMANFFWRQTIEQGALLELKHQNQTAVRQKIVKMEKDGKLITSHLSPGEAEKLVELDKIAKARKKSK